MKLLVSLIEPLTAELGPMFRGLYETDFVLKIPSTNKAALRKANV